MGSRAVASCPPYAARRSGIEPCMFAAARSAPAHEQPGHRHRPPRRRVIQRRRPALADGRAVGSPIDERPGYRLVPVSQYGV